MSKPTPRAPTTVTSPTPSATDLPNVTWPTEAAAPPALRGTRPGDHIEGPLSHKLAGVRLQCQLSTGGSQAVAFGLDDVRMTLLDRSGNQQTALHGIYRARELRPGLFLVHWLNEQRNAHVGMVLDVPTKRVDVAAKLPGSVELFDQGTIDVLTGGAAEAATTDAGTGSARQDVVDIVGGPTTDDLTGVTIAYSYAKAGTFCIRYGQGKVSFGMPATPTEPPAGMLTVPARIRKLQDELYMAHWFSPDPARTIHCVHIADFAQKRVYLAALMMPFPTEDFDWANIALLTGRWRSA